MTSDLTKLPFLMRYKHALAVGSAAIILGGLFAISVTGDGGEPPVPKVADRIFAFVVDNTDPLSPTQSRLLDEKFSNLPQTLRSGDRVLVIEMTADTADPIIYLFDKPYPNFASGLERAVTDKAILEEQDRETLAMFMGDLRTALNKAKAPEKKPNSPIYESMSAIGAYLINQPGDAELYLLLASDYLQNAGGCSHYVKLESEICNEIASQIDLTGVEVEAIYLRRSSQRRLQSKDHRQLIQDMLQVSGAVNVVYREW